MNNYVFSQTFSTTTDLNIPDAGAEVCSPITVTGIGTINGSTLGLQSVTIKINHTYDSDLDIYLVAPDGTRIELSTGNGSGGDNYGSGTSNNNGPYTVFDMSGAAGNITGGTAPFQNTYIPEGNLGDANNGQNADGTWNLCVTDDAGGDTGFINAWGLTFSAPPPSPANDLCANATALPCGTSNLAGTTVNTTSNADPAGCASNYGVWYTFTGDGGETTISSSATFDHEMIISYGSCGSFTNVVCDDGSTGTESHTFTTTNGVDYYVYIAHYSTSSTTTGTFTISRSCIAPPTCTPDATINSTTYSNTGLTTCGFGDDYGSGDACGSQYMNGDDIVIAWTPNSTECVDINLSNTGTYTGVFILDNCPDIGGANCLDNNTNSSGNPSISGFSVTSGNTYYIVVSTYPAPQCTAFDLDIVSCPPPPANDLCANATALPCGASNLVGTTVNATNNADPAGCASNYGVWYTFTGDGGPTVISSSATFDHEMVIYSGSCGSLSNVVCEDGSTGDESYTFTTTNGVDYYVYIAHYSTSSTTTGAFTISRSCPTPPANDECSGAINLTANNDLNCTSTTSGTIELSSASTVANSCGGTDDDDVWFSFVATATTHYVDLLNVSGSTTDMYHVLYSGTCGSLTQMYCSDANASTANGLIIGNTYYIRVYTWTSTGGQNSTFDMCITTDPPPISTCSGSYYDTGGSGAKYSANEYYTQTYCSSTPGQCLTMNFSSFNTESSFDELTIYNGVDVTASVIGTYSGNSLPNGGTITANSGCLTIEFDSDGSNQGQGWEFSLSCGACPPPSCSDGVQNGTETGVDCGGSCPACPVIGPCGNLNNNDFCSDPAVLTQGGSGWSSSTSNIYSYDDPGTSFCGSIENNSWYVFTAQSTTETFNFTNISNCVWDDGIQAEVFDVTTDANGCCTSLSSVSNCWNPWSTNDGSVTATGLTIGNDYYLMVDGWGGDNCDFTVTNWSATGILPVTLTSFTGYNYNAGNKLKWTTQSEVNNDYFIVQRSKDAKNFTNIGIIDGNGNSNIENNYEFIDNDFLSGVNYYRLKQIDFNGDYEHSRIIVLKSIDNIDIAIYPNPSSDKLYFDISDSFNESLTVTYSNILGATIKENITTSKDKNTYEVKEFKNLESGIYLIQILNSNNEVIKQQKIVKN